MCRGLSDSGLKVGVNTTNANKGIPLPVPASQVSQPHPNVHVTYYQANRSNNKIRFMSISRLIGLWRASIQTRVLFAQGLFNWATPITALIGVLRKKPVLVSPRGALAEEVIQQRKTLLKRLWLIILMRPFANSILWLATSAQERQEVLHRFPGSRVLVVPNGIDLALFRDIPEDSRHQFEQRFRVSSDTDPVIVNLGRIHPKKALSNLVRSFSQLLKDYPKAHLLIAGPNELGERDRLQKLVDELSLSNQVTLLDHLSGKDKLIFLAGADLFILPSKNENFGLVYAEALAAGTPVIASTATPWQHLDAIGCGRWVPSDVVSIHAAAIDLLARDTNAAGAKGRRWVFENLDYSYISRQLHKSVSSALEISIPGNRSLP